MFLLRFYSTVSGNPLSFGLIWELPVPPPKIELQSIFLTIPRQVILFAPLAWLLILWGLSTFADISRTDGNTAIVSLLLYQKDRRN